MGGETEGHASINEILWFEGTSADMVIAPSLTLAPREYRRISRPEGHQGQPHSPLRALLSLRSFPVPRIKVGLPRPLRFFSSARLSRGGFSSLLPALREYTHSGLRFDPKVSGTSLKFTLNVVGFVGISCGRSETCGTDICRRASLKLRHDVHIEVACGQPVLSRPQCCRWDNCHAVRDANSHTLATASRLDT